MMARNTYPKCFQSFKNWYLSNPKWENYYHKIGSPLPFDVTLRDGLNRGEQMLYTIEKKQELYYNLMFNYRPKNIEFGSMLSQKELPMFTNTIDLFNSVQNGDNLNKYILIPNKNMLIKVINNHQINSFSFITSVSNSFQKKNTKLSLEESDNEIQNMINLFTINSERYTEQNIKLYVSCINECPLEGKIDNDFIVNRILKLSKLKINTICLSDTCGTLNIEDFEYIVDTCLYFGLHPSKISLHLHVKKGREKEVEKKIHMALNKNIIDFDVSLFESEDCSVTMNKNIIITNLSYDLYYKSLCNYIMFKTQET